MGAAEPRASSGGGAPVSPPAAGEAPSLARIVQLRAAGYGLKTSRAEDVPAHYRAAVPALATIRASPHYPLVVTPDPDVLDLSFNGERATLATQVPLNGAPFAVDGALFEGQVEIHVAGLKSSVEQLFAGKKRTIHLAAQGRFKRRVKLASFVTGQEFHEPMGKGGEWIADFLLRCCARIFSRTTIVDATGEAPCFLNPVMAACQLVNVSRPGEEPDMWTAPEDCRLMSPALADKAGAPLAADKRRRWCDEPRNVAGLEFDPELVWTFHLYQHIVSFGDYRAHVLPPMPPWDLTRVLGSQPLGFMCKDMDSGLYAYNLLAWHERLLYPDEWAERERARKSEEGAASSVSSLVAGVRSMFGLQATKAK